MSLLDTRIIWIKFSKNSNYNNNNEYHFYLHYAYNLQKIKS